MLGVWIDWGWMNWGRVLVKVTVPTLGNRGAQNCSATVTRRVWVWVWKGTSALFAFSDAASAALSCLLNFQHVVWLLCQLRHVILLGFLHIRADVNTLNPWEICATKLLHPCGECRKDSDHNQKLYLGKCIALWPQGTESAACPWDKVLFAALFFFKCLFAELLSFDQNRWCSGLWKREMRAL